VPIKPENKHRYPKNWDWITARIHARAVGRCECTGECGKHPSGERCDRYHLQEFRLPEDEAYMPDMFATYSDVYGKIHQEWSDEKDCWVQIRDPYSYVKIVLTVAHLDHTPENCDFSNLKAMCQRCHLAYDAQHHAQSRYETKRLGKVSHDLFALTQPKPAPTAGVLPGASNDRTRRTPALPMLQAGPRDEDPES
jgi:hypothetical protein